MKQIHRLIFVLITFLSSNLIGQSIGNEWINYSQKYFRVNVFANNVYRIDYNTVAQAFSQVGLSVAGINPKRFQVFGRGEEVAIFVKGDADGSFDSGDFIEFYGRKNDGWFDTRLYVDSIHQPNPYYSLFNDTASYYLTYNNLTNNKRFTPESGTNFSTYSEVPYFLKHAEINYNSNYYLGYLNEMGIGNTEYSEGEGWTSAQFTKGYTYTENMPTQNVFVAGPDTKIEVCTQGRSAGSHAHHLQIQFPGQTVDTIYTQYPVIRTVVSVANNLLGTTTPITINSINVDGEDNYQSISFIKLIYPHSLTLENNPAFSMFLPIFGALPKAVLKVNSTSIASNSGDTAIFYDLTNNIRINPTKTGSQFTCLVNNLSSTKEMLLTSEQKIAQISQIIPVNNNATFTNFGTEPYLSSDYLIITHQSLRSEAEQYKTYRQTSGYPELYTPIIADVDELYDQFSYGIRKNPLAIRNFVRFAMVNFHQIPKNLFLIGKSYRAGENSNTMPMYRKNSVYYNGTLVPTFGTPPSDNMFTSGLINPNDFSIAIPTGRLSAKVPEHVTLYLNKVVEYENAMRTPQQWMKNILHFAGGTGQLHIDLLGYLNQFKATIEDTLFGGYVRTFEKTTTEPIQINQSDSLKNIINNGVSLMTFFGHAAGIGFDISIDNPEDYNNAGKYPMLLGLSCYAGDLYTTGVGADRGSSSEQFVLIANKGTIAYLAMVSEAIDSYLYQYTKRFYQNIGQLHYGKSIGYNIQQTIGNLTSIPYLKETCLELTYHGDPAIVLNSFEKPDYVITPADISFNPALVTTEYDSLTINIQLRNIGRAIDDSINVHIKRTLPNNSTADYFVLTKAPLYADSIALKIPINRVNGVGTNQFFIQVDDDSRVDEISETNNSTTVLLSIVSSDIIPVYPQKYAVIDSNRVVLKASTGSPLTPNASYVFEIDTTDLFNSPLKQGATINASGGLIQWNLPLVLTDNRVYFWRVSKQGDTLWKESSFQYIHGKKGWEQAHFFQFKNDFYQLVNYNRPLRRFDFIQDVKSLKAQTGYYGYGIPHSEIWYKINGSIMSQEACALNVSNGFKIAVINPHAGTPWLNPDSTAQFTPSNSSGLVGQLICHNYSTYGFDFLTSDTASREKLANFIDSIPSGYYVLAMSLRSNFAPQFNEHLYHAFESFGSTNIRTLSAAVPYLIFGKKGINLLNPGDTVVERVAMASTDVISIEKEYRTNWDQGYIVSELIGPALSWGSAHWRISSHDASDSVSLSMYGVTAQGNEVFIQNYPLSTPDIYNLNTLIDAHQYPYLKLKLNAKDKINNTPPQIKSWHVLFEPAPETAIDPDSYFSFYNTSVQEGDSVRFAIATHNISDKNMDSLLVTYRLIRNNTPVWSKTKRLRPHPAGDVLVDSVAAPTMGFVGLNALQVEFNPVFDQPEQTHFNNIAEVNFMVSGDRINPIMDVTFDGVRIMNGDLVSSKPTIQITLKDENRFMLMNSLKDTSLFRIRLKSPTDADYVIVPFYNNGVELLKFVPASANNKCHVLYHGNFLTDGIYQLEIEAMDKSNNLSAINKYMISFEVLNKSTITDVMNWPNPFSTATHFVFTLTGSEIPTFFKIQIMTITGKLVREIDLSELGTLHIGRNITDYAWDGKDQYGDQLANGIYLYRVVTNIKGENIEKKESGASKYFTKEFGKMCLIR